MAIFSNNIVTAYSSAGVDFSVSDQTANSRLKPILSSEYLSRESLLAKSFQSLCQGCLFTEAGHSFFKRKGSPHVGPIASVSESSSEDDDNSDYLSTQPSPQVSSPPSRSTDSERPPIVGEGGFTRSAEPLTKKMDGLFRRLVDGEPEAGSEESRSIQHPQGASINLDS